MQLGFSWHRLWVVEWRDLLCGWGLGEGGNLVADSAVGKVLESEKVLET